ncbi:MAG: dTDP-4-dehydrorhamnose reductase [Pseudomonadota bacterium]
MILIVGGNGQLGFELQRTAPADLEVVAIGRPGIDITSADSIDRVLQQYQPEVVINVAAYTNVDKAESETSLAWEVNCTGAENLAQAAAKAAIRLIHVSTDFVFDGGSCRPRLPQEATAPRSVYGKSKLAGEQAVLQHCGNSLVVRTSWLYSSHGHNFVKTMLRLMAEKDSLGVVVDQVGTPTWAKLLAEVIWDLQATDATGLFHCSNNGVASWYDFAVAIQEEAVSIGLLEKMIAVKPIRTEAYPLPAERPAYSVLDVSATEQLLGRQLPHWRESLRSMLLEM